MPNTTLAMAPMICARMCPKNDPDVPFFIFLLRFTRGF